VGAAIKHFGIIDVLVTNAGIFRTKAFTEFTTGDFNRLVSINLLGFVSIAQLTMKQKYVVSITWVACRSANHRRKTPASR
jgi:NAD(P)-dependent dehydrogenase (short-subunit alcohol dehydrogenase family)